MPEGVAGEELRLVPKVLILMYFWVVESERKTSQHLLSYRAELHNNSASLH